MAATVRAFVLNARAKFNLYLKVGALASNGLHQIRSLVADLSVCDEVSFLPSDRGFSVSCDDPAIPERDNLAWHAARALDIELPDIRIHIRKVLPSQAGLGGGSADAAATLRGIAALLAESGVTISPEMLNAAATRVGSDVPACLVPGLRLVDGTGEIVKPVRARAPHWGVLLFKPSLGVATARAYELLDAAREAGRNLERASATALVELCDAMTGHDFGRACALAHNDFGQPIEEAYSEISDARRRVVAAGAAATILCGSGSCVAGLFENVGEAQKALTLVRPGPGEWAVATGFSDGR